MKRNNGRSLHTLSSLFYSIPPIKIETVPGMQRETTIKLHQDQCHLTFNIIEGILNYLYGNNLLSSSKGKVGCGNRG